MLGSDEFRPVIKLFGHGKQTLNGPDYYHWEQRITMKQQQRSMRDTPQHPDHKSGNLQYFIFSSVV